METRILPVDINKIGQIAAIPLPNDFLDELDVQLDLTSPDAQILLQAAQQLKNSDTPVAFPTETVYGLGADATRSAAVRGIYAAKKRPPDNPLIVHIASLDQLRSLLQPTSYHQASQHGTEPQNHDRADDSIPEIYRVLISRFWPGPLTIILPNPRDSRLAPEVTAGLDTFGARMPGHPLALALIRLANVPIAAPSANASTKPSPTAATHVFDDLQARIQLILDGGPCDVGVESTVIDGLSKPPLVLRPGGVSLEQIRSCPGWQDTQIGYKNTSELGKQPKAPGMKYRHYSPNATVVLYEAGMPPPEIQEIQRRVGSRAKLGIIRTKTWTLDPGHNKWPIQRKDSPLLQTGSKAPFQNGSNASYEPSNGRTGVSVMLQSFRSTHEATTSISEHTLDRNGSEIRLLEIDLGPDTTGIARGIFAALRMLDRRNVDAILVEGIDDNEGDTAAAVMNRLRKAAEVTVEN